jgi:probable HAF family extracellular repeat protein
MKKISAYFRLMSIIKLTILAALCANAQEVRYTITDLGTLGGGSVIATDINESGQVVGYAHTANGQWDAFVYQDGSMQDLGTFGGENSIATGINNSGQVVGKAQTADSTWVAFLWQNGSMQNLGTFGGSLEDGEMGISINDNSLVVGSIFLDDQKFRAFLWHNGNIQVLGTLGGDHSHANGINNAGQIVGSSRAADGTLFPFLWQDGNMQNLGSLAGHDGGLAAGINNQGKVVGRSHGSIVARAFLWENGSMQGLGTLGGSYDTAMGINDSTQIVGVSAGGAGGANAFLWEDGEMKNLNDLIDPESGWVLRVAFAINNKGQIVGHGQLNGQVRGFLLTPIDCYLVNSTGDTPNKPGSGDICDTGSTTGTDSPECTLRAAIEAANASGKKYCIVFDLPDNEDTVTPQSSLPAMQGTGSIDGSVKNDKKAIIDGSLAGSEVNGLVIEGDSIKVNNLAIRSFEGYGIKIDGGTGHELTGNEIGYDDDLEELNLNTAGGILITGGATGVIIGGVDDEDTYNYIGGGIAVTGDNTRGIEILMNYLEVPEDWLASDVHRIPIDLDEDGPTCTRWEQQSVQAPNNSMPPPRILSLDETTVRGMTHPSAKVIVYKVEISGSQRGRYFARKVEPLAHGEADAEGAFIVSHSAEEADLLTFVAIDSEGNTSELSQLKRPVIYAPGIGGSWLRGENGDRLWLPLALTDAEKNNRLERLTLNDSGQDIELLRVDGVLELLGFSGYGPALKFLQENGYPGDPENGNMSSIDLWRYPNDWRKNPYDLADDLKALVDYILDEENPVARACEVDIVSHSNGGVIASTYIRKYPEHSRTYVNRMLTIGTPYLGTPQAAAAQTRGYIFKIEEALRFTVEWGRMIGMTRNITGAYGLMPSRKYWEATDFGSSAGYLWDLEGRALTSYNETFSFITAPKVDEFTLPHGLNRNAPLWNNTESNVHGLIDDWRQWQGPPHIFRLVGNMPASTTVKWIWDPSAISSIPITEYTKHEEPGDLIEHIFYRGTQIAVPGFGDGTVSLSSATLGHHPSVGATDFSGVDNSDWIEPFEYYPCDHMGLIAQNCLSQQTGNSIYNRVLDILRSSYIVPSSDGPLQLKIQPNELASAPATEDNAIHEVFYFTANAPIGVHIYEQQGNHTGPVNRTSTAVSDSIIYDIAGIGYWPNLLAATVSLDRNTTYDVEIIAPVESAQVRVLRVVLDPEAHHLQMVFPQIVLETGGSLKMHLAEGGIPENAPFLVDITGNGIFDDILDPALSIASQDPAPALPAPDRYIYSVYVNPDEDDDRIVTLGFRGTKDNGWSWELSGNSDWVNLDSYRGTLDQPPGMTILSTSLPEGVYDDTMSIVISKDDFTTTNNIIVRLVKDATVSVEITEEQLPIAYRLSQNYPNPFNPSTLIRFELPEDSPVRLTVYDILGREVQVLANDWYTAGSHTVEFDASRLPSGVYLYRLEAGGFTETKRMVLLQ